MTKILFVCLGNICRSPAADGYLNHIIKQKDLKSFIHCDSAGTSAYHQGEPADLRMRQTANQRGYQLESISRQFTPDQDFDNFDLIIAMDDKNLRDLNNCARNEQDKNKIRKMTDYCLIHDIENVPDPYYGSDDGFNLVLDIVEDACNELVKSLTISIE